MNGQQLEQEQYQPWNPDVDTSMAAEAESPVSVEYAVLNAPYFQPVPVIMAVASAFFLLETIVHHSPFKDFCERRFKATQPQISDKKLRSQTKQAITRLVGCVHNIMQVPLGLHVLLTPSLITNKLHGVTPASRMLCCISAGYFLHDFIDTLINLKAEGSQYLVHAVASLYAFASGALLGTMHWYGGGYLMWEISTPLTQLRWFLWKIGLEDSLAYLINGVIMGVAFVMARNIWGVVLTYIFFAETRQHLLHGDPAVLSPTFLWLMRASNLILTGLNFFWGSKIVGKLYRILAKGESQKPLAKDHEG